MTALFIVDSLLGGALKNFGIHPRDVSSIYTIFTAPWLHADFWHLAGNMASFAVFGFLALLNGPRYFASASAIIIVISGLLLWLFGRDANHIGASGWIFGLWSLSIVLAWFERSLRHVLIGMAVIFFYGTMVFGMLPSDQRISFEGHIFGAIAGIGAAWLLSRKKPLPRAAQPEAGGLKFWP
ncbi:MAG: rhomboid family intramembrane serine protease [Sphingopyxis sp.]